MKIAAKVSLTAVTALLGLGLGVTPVWSQNVNVSTSASGVNVSVAPGPETASVNVSTARNDADEVSFDEEADDGQMDGSPAVPDSVKNVVKRLNHATKDITLEDLNSAREAVVKLDVLIDIEKRLNDLVSLRKEREETVDDFSDQIPSSALAGGGPSAVPLMTQPMPTASVPVPVSSSVADFEVMRVTGASGRYAALIKDSDGSETQVRVGDMLVDGSRVNGISRHGVTVKNGSKRRTVQVKDVGTIFTGK